MNRLGSHTWPAWSEFFAEMERWGTPIFGEEWDYWDRRMFGRMQGRR